MRHNRPTETRATRRVPKSGGQFGPVSPPPSADRRSRLTRWASLLERDPHRLIALLRPSWATGEDIAPMAATPNAIDLAWADPVFRVTGLKGRSRGDVKAFFQLSDTESTGSRLGLGASRCALPGRSQRASATSPIRGRKSCSSWAS